MTRSIKEPQHKSEVEQPEYQVPELDRQMAKTHETPAAPGVNRLNDLMRHQYARLLYRTRSGREPKPVERLDIDLNISVFALCFY